MSPGPRPPPASASGPEAAFSTFLRPACPSSLQGGCQPALQSPAPFHVEFTHVPTVVVLKRLETSVGRPALFPPALLFYKVKTWNKSSPPSTVVVISRRKRQARPPEVGGLRLRARGRPLKESKPASWRPRKVEPVLTHAAGVGFVMSVSCLEGTWPAPVVGSQLGPRGCAGDLSPPWGQLGG